MTLTEEFMNRGMNVYISFLHPYFHLFVFLQADFRISEDLHAQWKERSFLTKQGPVTCKTLRGGSIS